MIEGSSFSRQHIKSETSGSASESSRKLPVMMLLPKSEAQTTINRSQLMMGPLTEWNSPESSFDNGVNHSCADLIRRLRSQVSFQVQILGKFPVKRQTSQSTRRLLIQKMVRPQGESPGTGRRLHGDPHKLVHWNHLGPPVAIVDIGGPA